MPPTQQYQGSSEDDQLAQDERLSNGVMRAWHVARGGSCGAEKPTCASCARLNKECVYDSGQTTSSSETQKSDR
ncbi:hypothetical protein L198_07508 [Cryptococcus wingfieldii CBS 7118]|uniref:Zn(2)-C6 fungal-type domain-containing protein n=1 Tax=Cryptococcus wingfieldii CBS 7118 TaxID=1295528 RepID=A0A1E3IAL0_9TREE|nr:hypothetical protein L198_07508 [Cryptococcus wingfieldii CBS 7118]ODN85679.1 hypothetical protein L198_07508 [Cryptococcus wingfieldii CBS 7118]